MQRAQFKTRKSLSQYCREKRERQGKAPYRWPKPKPGTPQTPRKAIRQQSTAREAEMSAYNGQRMIFLARYPVCVACLTRDINPAPSAQIHHLRGRVKKLLRDERFWLAVCASCHDWIHTNPRDARELGLLSSATEFNRMPPPEQKAA